MSLSIYRYLRLDKNLKRVLNKKSRSFSSEKRTRVLILGSGWGSYSMLKNINRKEMKIKIVTPRNHFLFTPLLCSTTVGTLEFRSITEPIRNIGLEDPSDLILAHAESVDMIKKTVQCRSILDSSVFDLYFDKLVIGVGCLNNTFGIPGVEKYACFLKEIKDAQKIRSRIIQNCEAASALALSLGEKERLLHTVIVGGGPTGVEFGAELYDFKVQDVKKLYKHEEKMFHVTLIEAANILSGFDQKLQLYAEKKINERANFMLVKASVVEVTEKYVVLSDGTKIPCGLVVWSTGLSPQPFIKNLLLPKNNRGQVLTDQYLRVLDDPSKSIYALGDCADIKSCPLPCTAQVAERQGKYLARSLNSLNKSETVENFKFTSRGMLAYIGGYKALTDLPEFKDRGFTSWFLWRSAYLTQLGSWRARMQVPIDWFKTLCFGRDTSHFY